jgi:hypothetical protein
LVSKQNLSAMTDIDIAIEGLKGSALTNVRKKIKTEADAKIDIVCLETTNPGFRHEIMKNRILLCRC